MTNKLVKPPRRQPARARPERRPARRPDALNPRRGIVWMVVRRDDGGMVTIKEHVATWEPLRTVWMIVDPVGGGSDLIHWGPIYETWEEAVAVALATVDAE